MSQRIAVIDYGMGNLRSVQKAFESQGARAVITADAKVISAADKVVVPGVGAFGAAMKELRKRKLLQVIKDKIATGAPYLGLCLGLQVLFEESEESEGRGAVKGLGIVPGRVLKFRGALKVPHMGWNTLEFKKKNCPLFKGISSGDYFYFVHSYYAKPSSASWLAATTPYGQSFCSALWKDNIFAFQCHPEKSQDKGLRLIKNFIKL